MGRAVLGGKPLTLLSVALLRQVDGTGASHTLFPATLRSQTLSPACMQLQRCVPFGLVLSPASGDSTTPAQGETSAQLGQGQ